jgi:predicted S18 family serine protease
LSGISAALAVPIATIAANATLASRTDFMMTPHVRSMGS